MCDDCSEKAKTDMRAAADAYPNLATTQEIATRPSLGRSGAVFPGSVSPACDHADEILQSLRAAEDWLRIERGDEPSQLPRAHDERVIAAARAYLDRHHNDVMATGWAVGYAQAMRRLAAGAARHLHHDTSDKPAHTPVDGVCPDCRAASLVHVNQGKDTRVTCRACGRSMTWDHYEGHMEHLRRVAATVRVRRRLAVSDAA